MIENGTARRMIIVFIADLKRDHPRLLVRFYQVPRKRVVLLSIKLPAAAADLWPEAVEMLPEQLANLALEIDMRLAAYEER